MNASGEILVAFNFGQLRWVTREGVLIRSDSLPIESGAGLVTADLGLDQCTLYYFAFTEFDYGGRLRRYDVCSHKPMADLTQGLSYAFGGVEVRVARDGAVWFAGRDRVYRLTDHSREEFLTPAGDIALALTPPLDDRTLWLVGLTTLRRVDIRSGTILAGPETSGPGQNPSLAIHTVARASAQVTTATAPALSAFGIAVLIATIALFALRRLT
jgi:hypothetical protein